MKEEGFAAFLLRRSRKKIFAKTSTLSPGHRFPALNRTSARIAGEAVDGIAVKSETRTVLPAGSRKAGPMAERFKCAVCEMEETRCECEKYCTICQGEHNVRLCQDGSYYCQECREICDFIPQT